MKKFERQAQSQRKHGPLPVSSSSKAPAPPPRSRPEWTGPGYVKKPAKRPPPSPAPQGPIQTTQPQLLPVELQQLVLDIFRDVFPASGDFEAMKPLLQEINDHLLAGDVETAFGKEEFLEGYAIRWSPSRALALSNLLAWICEQRKDDDWVKWLIGDDEKPAKALCFGGGATEIMAFAGLLRQVRKNAVGRPNIVYSTQSSGASDTLHTPSASALPITPLDLHLVDAADWSSVLSKLYAGLTTAPTLSKYASSKARALNASFLSPQALEPSFKRADILDLTSEDLRSIVGPEPVLLTLFFTLNDLYDVSIRRTTTFLRMLTTVAPKGCLLVVVDSHDAAFSGVIAKDKEEGVEYPMSWLLNQAMLPARKKQEEDDDDEPETLWEKLIDDCDSLYKLPEKGLLYPASLENMKAQVHLFKRV
jgi:25S rRNA (uracil2843-N3)-methyltransferase